LMAKQCKLSNLLAVVDRGFSAWQDDHPAQR
jgi:hypothetical protein